MKSKKIETEGFAKLNERLVSTLKNNEVLRKQLIEAKEECK